MSQASCIERVILQVDAATQPERLGQKRIVVDTSRRTAVGANWFRPSTLLKYFLVSTNEVAKCQTSVIYISDSSHRRALGLKVEFDVRCTEGNEERAAEALCDDPNPGTVLIGKIREWVHDHISRQPDAFLDAFLTAKTELESQLAARALDEIGLNLSATIFLCGEDKVVRNIKLDPLELRVKLKDYGESLRVRLLAELMTGQEDLLNAIAYRSDDVGLEELVRQSALRYFAEHVTLHQFYEQREDVTAGLRSHLEEALLAVGRRVQSFEVEFDEQVPSKQYEAQADIEYRVPGYPEPIIIRNAAQISIQNYASYLSANSPELGAWFDENLNQVVQQTLCGKRYENILLSLEPLSRELTNKMSFKASAIGCGIQQQLRLTSPRVELWLKGFNLVAEGSFETRFEGLYVRVKTSAVVMLKQLQGVKHYLERGLDIPKLMESRVIDEIRQTLQALHPEHLFAGAMSSETNDAEPLRPLLSRKIRDLLGRDFDAEVISLSVEMPDTDFSAWIKNLRREPISFEAEVASHSPHSPAPLIFYGDCRIEGVSREGWEKVLAVGFDVDKLKGQLVNALKSGTETRRGVDLVYSSGEAAEKVKGEIARLVTDYALREFGLRVKVCNVRRKATEIEKTMREAGLANELLRIEMIRKLEQHLIQLIANGGKEEEIAQARKRIALLNSYSPVQAMSRVDESRSQETAAMAEPTTVPTVIADGEVAANVSRETEQVLRS